ncbi:unnamed protein product [Rhizophagus irregularis]|nr:unnamed protein product [Rhizophagus irregularis]CAB5389432.1 unnamed protein product [Rhizophagus irregularis]
MLSEKSPLVPLTFSKVSSYDRSFIQGRQAYRCTWEGCKEQLSNNSKFKDLLITLNLFFFVLSATCNNSHQFQSSDDLHHHLIYRHNDSVMNYTGADDMTKREKGDTSEDEDYKNYFDKRNDKRYYGKSENEIIWEALCSYSDPKLIEKIESDFKLLKITKILMMV